MRLEHTKGWASPAESAATIEALLSVDDLSELLHTSPRQVRNMRARGQLPNAVKVPGLGLRWPHATVYSWVAGLRGEEKSS